MLADVASRLEKAVETARTSGASDGVTAQLELLHQLSGLLSVAGEEQVKAVQGSIEASCLGAALLGPPPAVAQLCANVLITIYRRGARTTLYTTVGQLLSWLSNKVSPASAPAAKLATVHLLGGLCAAHGGAMVSLCLDSITLLTKLTRSAEPSVRPMAWAAFGRACTGSGGVPRAAQDEAVKNLKHALTERGSPNELRAAALAAAPMLAAYSEGLWVADLFESLTQLCTRALDDASPVVRAAAAGALADVLLASLARPAGFGTASAAGGAGGAKGAPRKLGLKMNLPGKRAEASSPIEAAANVLSAPFVKPGASKEVRAGLARATVAVIGGMKRAELERHSEFLVAQLLGMLNGAAEGQGGSKASGRGDFAAEAISHALRAGLGERLSERGQQAMATSLAAHASCRASPEGLTLVCLSQLYLLLLQLREVAADARDLLLQGERPLLALAASPVRQLRLAACACLWALVLAFPSHLAPLLNVSLNRLRAAAAEAAAAKEGAPREAATAALLGHAQAVGTLLGAMARTPHGGPSSLATAALHAAADLVAAGGAGGAAGWLLVRALLSLPTEWLSAKPRLTRLYALLKGALASPPPEVTPKRREAVEAELHARAHALHALRAFLERMPESAALPLLKPVTSTFVPPSLALLAACREHAPRLMSEPFRAAYMLFRARLYEVLLALPSSALTAKVLNVVMPLVVADIVEPANTHGAICTALASMLAPADAVLAPATAPDAPVASLLCEPLRGATCAEAEGSCEWLAELRGGSHATSEGACLDAAVGLFGAVFRLQTSDVRQQLLGHLGNAAARVTKESKPSTGGGFFGGGGSDAAKDEAPSGLVNICAALLGSLQRLATKPSRSALRPELTPAFAAVLAPCLAEPDVSVRRGAAQAVGLLGQLLGAAYADAFSTAAAKLLTDTKAKEEARAGHALALGLLLSSSAPAAAADKHAAFGRVRSGVQLLCSLLPTPAAATATATASPPPAGGRHASEWALHSLARVAAVLGGDFRPLTGATLSGVSAVALAPAPPLTARAAQGLAALSTTLAASLLPSLSAAAGAGKPPQHKGGQHTAMLFRCRVLVAAARRAHPLDGRSGGAAEALLAEELRFERLLLSLPSGTLPSAVAAPPPAIHEAVLRGLASRHPGLRAAAVEALREFGVAGAGGGATGHTGYAMPPSTLGRAAVALLSLMDGEVDREALDAAKRVTLSLLHADGGQRPIFWLRTLGDVVQEVVRSEAELRGSNRGDDEEAGGEEGSGWDQNASGLPTVGGDDEDEEEDRKRQKEAQLEAEENAKWAHVAPRWQTRLYAAECVRRLLDVADHSAHYDLTLAREETERQGGSGERLVLHLGRLVSVAFTVATSRIEAMRPAGVLMLLDVVERFAAAPDPDYEGHLLLEQSHAQLGAALRPCFGPEADPSLTASGAALLARYLLAISTTSGGIQVDPAAIRKLLALLTKRLTPAALAAISYPALSDAAATMVRTTSLRAAAALQAAAAREPEARAELCKQMQPSLVDLRSCWMGLLRDHAALSIAGRAAKGYVPHLYVQGAATASREHLEHAAPLVFEAALSMVATPEWVAGRGGGGGGGGGEVRPEDPHASATLTPIEAGETRRDFDLLFGMCTHALAAAAERRPADGSPPDARDDEAAACTLALPQLLSEAHLQPDVLPPGSFELLLSLLARLGEASPHPQMRDAVAAVAAHLAPRLGGYAAPPPTGDLVPPLGRSPADAARLVAAAQQLCVAPALRAIPALRAPASLCQPPPPQPIPVAELRPLALAVEAIATLPDSLPAGAALPYLPTAFTVVLRVTHAVATSPPVADPPGVTAAAALREACLTSMATLRRRCAAPADADERLEEASSGLAVAKATLRTSAAASALELLQATPVASRGLMLRAVLALVEGLPLGGGATAVHTGVAAAAREMVASETQGEAHAALLAFLAAIKEQPDLLHFYLTELLPDVAASFKTGCDRLGAIKLLLLACTLSTAEAAPALFSLTLPLLIHGMSVAADGPPSKVDAELSAVAHAALTALASRSADAFRASVANFSTETRSRMEVAIREEQAKKQRAVAASPGAAVTAAKPKIALKMDFGSFSAKA